MSALATALSAWLSAFDFAAPFALLLLPMLLMAKARRMLATPPRSRA